MATVTQLTYNYLDKQPKGSHIKAAILCKIFYAHNIKEAARHGN